MKKMNSLFVKGFQSSKCKTQLRLGTSRIKLLRNKKGIQIASDRKEVADFLRNRQEGNARLLVDRLIMEQSLVDAYDLLYLYAERVAAQLSVIESQKSCPLNLKEDISTLLYASSKCAELTDFALIRPMFVAKYGTEFVSAATELRPGCGVNIKVIEMLSMNGATEAAKVKLMKDIAAEHDVGWDSALFERDIMVDRDDVLVSACVVDTEANSRSLTNQPELTALIGGHRPSAPSDGFPSVPNQKPSVGTYVSPPKDSPEPTSGRFPKGDVGLTKLPQPDGSRRDSPGASSETEPPHMKPPGRDQLRADDLEFDDIYSEVDAGNRELKSWIYQRPESDCFIVPSPQTRFQGEEARRKSIGVPREKSICDHTGSSPADMNKPLLQDENKLDRRDWRCAGIDDFDEVCRRRNRGKGPESGYDARQSEMPVGEGGFSRRWSRHEEQYHELDNPTRAANKEAFRRGSSHYEEHAEDDFLRRESPRKGRPQPQEQYGEEKFMRVSSGEGLRGKTASFEEICDDVGSHGLISVGGNEDKIHTGKDWKHKYFDDNSAHVSHCSEEPRHRDSMCNTPEHVDEEHLSNPVTIRNPEEDMLRKYYNCSVAKQKASYASKRAASVPPHYDSYEDEYYARRGGARMPKPSYNNFKASETRKSNPSLESGDEGSREGTRKLSSDDERRRDQHSYDQGSSRGRRYGKGDFLKICRHSNSDYDEQVFAANDHPPTSFRTRNNDKRMSLPGESTHREKHQGSRLSDDCMWRRATIGPQEVSLARSREFKDSPRGPFGEKESPGDSRRQSASMCKELQYDVMEGPQGSQKYEVDRHRWLDAPVVCDYDRSRCTPQGDDEYPPSTRTWGSKIDRQRTLEDGRPPRFAKVDYRSDFDAEELQASPDFKGDKPKIVVKLLRSVDEPRPRPRSKLPTAKTELRKTSILEHRKSRSVLTESPGAIATPASTVPLQKLPSDETSSPKSVGQPPCKATFVKPPDLDSLIQMFGKKNSL